MRSIVDVPAARVKAHIYDPVETHVVAMESSVHDSYENSATALELKIEEADVQRVVVWEVVAEWACLVLLLTMLNFSMT